MISPGSVELLAPAGNLSCALAAFDAGADAVYAGLKRFNARERTENFSADEMSRLLAYADKNGKNFGYDCTVRTCVVKYRLGGNESTPSRLLSHNVRKYFFARFANVCFAPNGVETVLCLWFTN